MKKAILLFTAALSLQSCATLFTGTKDTIHFESEPTGAKVQINGIDKGITPCDVVVRRKLVAPTVVIKKDGYETRSFELEHGFNGVAAINLLNLFAWAIDVATGSVMRYDTRFYNTQLDKKQ